MGATELLQCRACGALKPWTEFPRKGRESALLQTWCKSCSSAYKAARHRANHEREMVRIRRNSARQIAFNRAAVLEYLSTQACVDCGEANVAVLEFDQVRGVKRMEVSRLVTSGYSWAFVAAEIAKCEVRCANCHRLVTKARRALVGAAATAVAS